MATFAYQSAMTDLKIANNPKAQEDQLRAAAKLAKASITTKTSFNRYASIAWFLSTTQLYNTPGLDKKSLIADKIDSTLSVLEYVEDLNIRLSLAEVLITEKRSTEAADQLVKALQANQKFDTTGEVTFRDISARFMKLKELATLPADKVAAFEEGQARRTLGG